MKKRIISIISILAIILTIFSACKRKDDNDIAPASSTEDNIANSQEKDENKDQKTEENNKEENQDEAKEEIKQYTFENPIEKKVETKYSIYQLLTMPGSLSNNFGVYVTLMRDKYKYDEKLDTSLIFNDLPFIDEIEEKGTSRRFHIYFKNPKRDELSVDEMIEIIDKLNSYDYVQKVEIDNIDGESPDLGKRHFSKNHSYEELKKEITNNIKNEKTWFFDDEKKTISYEVTDIEPYSLTKRITHLDYKNLI